MSSLKETLKGKRDEILRIAAKHGARNVRVFGSAARGEAGPESDVDLLADVGPGRTPFFPGGLVADLKDLLGCRVHVLTVGAVRRYIRDHVLKEAVRLGRMTGSISSTSRSA